MSNPFDLIDARLATIEEIMVSIQIAAKAAPVEPIKPILCIEVSGTITSSQADCMRYVVEGQLKDAGWICIVLDGCNENRAVAFMPNGGSIQPLDISVIEEWMKSKQSAK